MKTMLISVMILVAAVTLSQPVEAKGKRAPRAYSYFEDDGKANQGTCDPEGKIPKKLKRQKEFAHSGAYIGSEKMDSDLKTEIVSWKHYFKNAPACNQYLSKVQIPR